MGRSGSWPPARERWWTYTLPWGEVAVADTVVTLLLSADRILIVTRDGVAIRTPLRRGTPGQWRPAFKAFQRGGFTFRVVPTGEFDEVIRLLRRRAGRGEPQHQPQAQRTVTIGGTANHGRSFPPGDIGLILRDRPSWSAAPGVLAFHRRW